MFHILELIRLEEAIELGILAILLAFIGGQMVRPDSVIYQKARRITAAVFLLYAVMGIFAWGIDGVTDLLLIILRASLAAAISFGLAVVTLAPAEFLIGHAKKWMPARSKPQPPAPKPAPPVPVAIRDYAAEEQAEKERMDKIDDARNVAARFYEEHQQLLAESLPPALFQTQCQTRFPNGVGPEQAWSAAEQMIAEMLPQIAKARECKRAEHEVERKQAEQTREEELRKKETEERRSAFLKLAEWYQQEQETIRQSLPDELDREDAMRQLFERYDKLMKDTYAEMKP